MADIFISYSKQNLEPTREVAAFLESERYSVWWDADLKAGERFGDVINRELDTAKAVIVIWTAHSVASDWVLAEAEHAHRDRKLIPLRTRDLDTRRIPKPYNILHTDVVDDRTAILAAVKRIVGVGAYQATMKRADAAMISRTKPWESLDERRRKEEVEALRRAEDEPAATSVEISGTKDEVPEPHKARQSSRLARAIGFLFLLFVGSTSIWLSLLSATLPPGPDAENCERLKGDDAIAACTRAIARGHLQSYDLSKVYVYRAVEYRHKGDIDYAIADFDRAIQLDPRNVIAYYNRGNAYRVKRDLDRALVDYDRAIQLDPKNINAYIGRGLAYSNKGDYDRAIADYGEAIRLDPKYADAYRSRGNAKRAKGDLIGSDDDIAEAARLESGAKNDVGPK